MTTVEQLRHQVEAIRAKVGRPDDPKHWVLQMPVGRDLPACVKEQMGAYDTVYIDRIQEAYYYGMCGPDAMGSCTVITTHGNFLVAMDTGDWTKVKQSFGPRRSHR